MTEWGGTGHMTGMWLWWILPVLLIIVTVWLIGRGASRGNGRAGESAEERLKRRYADGEIDREEYETRLKVLRR